MKQNTVETPYRIIVSGTSLATINYTGTKEQWKSIAKEDYWNGNCPKNMVINYNYIGN